MPLAFSSIVVSNVSDFEHAVAQIPDASLLDATGIVLRVHERLWLELKSAMECSADARKGAVGDADDSGLVHPLMDQAAAVATRAPNLPVYLLQDAHSSANASPRHVARHGPRHLVGSPEGTLFEQVTPALVKQIRQDDLANCVNTARSRCVIRASSNHHFVLPSGAHASQFLRLAEAFVDIETVDRVAYWVAQDIVAHLDSLENADATLVVDHPSMLILASRVQLLVPVHLHILAFPNYPCDPDTRAAAFDVLRRISGPRKRVFVLVGIASTGRMAAFVSRWANGEADTTVSTAILYGVSDAVEAASFCRLKMPELKHYLSAESCELCVAESLPVSIQSSNYMVGFAPGNPVGLPPPMFDAQKPFLERWGRYPGVLRVHYDDPNEARARHHAFYVDVSTLLDLDDFRAELIAALRGLDRAPDAIAVPDHPAARRLGTIVAEALAVPVVMLGAEALRGDGDVNTTLANARALLVLDDIFITGSRLDAINRFLRENRATRAPRLEAITFFTVLAIPSSEAKYRHRRTGLTRNHAWVAAIDHLYKFCLPDWRNEDSCPWCREQKRLFQLARATGDFDGPLADRLAALADTAHGLSDAAFFVANPATQLPALGAESLLMAQGASPIQVLFACASGVQQLRCADQNPLGADQFPAPSYLAQRVFTDNYTERLIWLGLLRVVRGNELEASLKAHLRRYVLNEQADQRPQLLAEFAVAALSGKLDAIEVSQESKRMFEAVGISWRALFDAALVDQEL